jgi:hypothetical protein
MSEAKTMVPPTVTTNAFTFVGAPVRAIALHTLKAHELIVKMTSDLSDEQLTRRPVDIPPSVAPSIGWHLWHIARWADLLQASLPGMTAELERSLGPGRQIWEAEGLVDRWGLAQAASGFRETGMGLDDEGSASLRLPGKQTLLEYAQRAFAAADRAVSGVDERLFETRCTDLYNRTTAVGTAVMSHLTHANRHLGMIEALRGTLGVRGTATI